MKKRHAVNIVYVLVFAVAAPISLCLAQTRAIDKRGDMLFEGRPFFTDSALYNGYDLGGSPLGLFDRGSPRHAVDVGYRYAGLGDGAGHYMNGMSFTEGGPGIAYFRFSYGPDLLSRKNGGNETSLTLHRFGLVVAGQAGSGIIRGSLVADGFYGNQKWAESDSARTFMGFERLRLDLGSRIHPALRIGVFFGVIGRYDSLYIPVPPNMRPESVPERSDRAGQINLPEFGASLDFGEDGLPVRSNLTFSYALSRFINTSKDPLLSPPYTWKPMPIPTDKYGYTTDKNGNTDAIRNDSFDLFWVTRGRVPVKESGFAFNPGLLFGLTGNAGEMRQPTDDNNIINLGDAKSSYDLSGIWFGLGTGFEALKYADAHLEYTLADMSLSVTPAVGAEKEVSRTLHHVSVGVSSRLNEYVELPVVIVPRLAWFASGTAGVLGARRLSLSPLDLAGGMSKAPLYWPERFLDGFRRVSGFTIGVDGHAFEGRLNASVWTTILSSSVEAEDGGLEFGLKVGFLVK
ncbi:MAG: hypothetical protein LBB74_08730 [Chitinispirillales bacterium]|jgi:hypothetical protein|nr:hypothetical protein [Chitinispirillales bacterium]